LISRFYFRGQSQRRQSARISISGLEMPDISSFRFRVIIALISVATITAIEQPDAAQIHTPQDAYSRLRACFSR
jgi:hypothetical protein